MTSPITSIACHRHRTRCGHCGAEIGWAWEDAFDKFGYADGDGLVMTPVVAETLQAYGYRVVYGPWGLHNVVITEVSRDGIALIPAGTDIGYADPRVYLPREIVDLLDRTFASGAEVLP